MKQTTETAVAEQPNLRSARAITKIFGKSGRTPTGEQELAVPVLQQINRNGLTAGPATVSDPSSFVNGSQAHVLYRDIGGGIWDSWHDTNGDQWSCQQINLSGVTNGPAAASDPSGFVYANETHILYRDAYGTVWDSSYAPVTNQWLVAPINLSGETSGPAAIGNPSGLAYSSQAHVFYRDVDGGIWDSWYDANGDQWLLRQINLSGVTNGPAAACDPTSFVWGNQMHIVYRDAAGVIWDSLYAGDKDQWLVQQINLSGLTSGPAAVGDLSSFVYNDLQSHIFYRAVDGTIWDSYYSGNTNQWLLQSLNSVDVVLGPLAAGDPRSFIYDNQTHILYRNDVGELWDCFYDGDSSTWYKTLINSATSPAGPAAVGETSSFTDSSGHILYRDAVGTIWEVVFDGDGLIVIPIQ